MGTDGRPFFQTAQARNISSHGALLSGIEHRLTPGNTIGVQCNDKKARFRVMWVIDAGLLQKTQAGVQIVDGQECPWQQELAEPEKIPPVKGQNRRRFARHKMSFPIEVRNERGGTLMQKNASDISGCGCYVETLLPLAVGTALQITFWIESQKINISGIIQASDPGVGMGIEFTGLSPEDQQRLQQQLDKLDEGLASRGGRKRDL